MSKDNKQNLDNDKAPNILQVFGSVMAAFFGVQSSKNKERDFKHGSFKVFLAVGLIVTFLFLATVISIVNWVIG